MRTQVTLRCADWMLEGFTEGVGMNLDLFDLVVVVSPRSFCNTCYTISVIYLYSDSIALKRNATSYRKPADRENQALTTDTILL